MSITNRYNVKIPNACRSFLRSPSNLTVMEIVGRIEANQDLFQRKYAKKMAAEDEYYKNRYKLGETNGTS